ncbi:3-ketoacyl-ACP reductase [Steroidobacter denitrificans]|uniref:3-ketoacyl-ACP reductase n=1 Tax=Steroidobacter denitrificans TaxID=465721 RepID=A0A127FB18_STEDE|nr:SDR family oxidoreductase [Steroidobacter denitrificans]AMN46800.1 3-ketoacyl-ACP reductase [Steroidobacter denitrificans]
MDLSNKTVVVTGAGRGIGRAISLELARHGANIALFDLNTADVEATHAQCERESVRVRDYCVNVAMEDEVSGAMAKVVADFGRLDGLVNNAGIVKDSLLVKVKDGVVTSRMSLDQWNAVISVNLGGAFLCAREAAVHMIEGGNGGVIVNISSISRTGNAGQTNYSAAKAGIESMGVVWAKELARYGIRVGSIAPGFTRTEILASMRPEVLEKLTAPVPLRRLGQPEEIAHAVRFIFENDFFTGRCLDIDGGLRL